MGEVFAILLSRLEKAVGVSEAVGLRLVPRRCLSALGGNIVFTRSVFVIIIWVLILV